MSDCKEILKRAKSSNGDDVIINNDKDFYLSVGIISFWLEKERFNKVKHASINFVTQSKSDEMLKRRLNDMFMKTNQSKFLDNWKGTLLSEVLTYDPIEDIKQCNKSGEYITTGFNYACAKRLSDKKKNNEKTKSKIEKQEEQN